MVSKVDKLWDDAMEGAWITRALLLTRLGYGLACFVLSAVTVFFVRSYKP